MDDQYEDQDDLLSSFPAVPIFPNSDDALHSHTNPFALSLDSHAGETYAQKIFDRFDDRKLPKANSYPNNSENQPLPEFIGMAAERECFGCRLGLPCIRICRQVSK
ncbi:hypothetical protein Nepgr_021232 [Nepenthes gracilis]|uniref:Uncharacterized protein n=1 Tax=Nepenthes gracilis TaxID=150966 RepID=A0AAD3SYQ1_NEPGR|nr:hypothetical protein Nepgr_021232 [Nepenthes gracilis]